MKPHKALFIKKTEKPKEFTKGHLQRFFLICIVILLLFIVFKSLLELFGEVSSYHSYFYIPYGTYYICLMICLYYDGYQEKMLYLFT